MAWFTKKEVCVHCGKNSTRRELDDRPTCGECRTKVLLGREPTLTCPVDGATLDKEHNQEIILDRCPECGGVWLDAGEIDAIREAGQTEGFMIGMVL